MVWIRKTRGIVEELNILKIIRCRECSGEDGVVLLTLIVTMDMVDGRKTRVVVTTRASVTGMRHVVVVVLIVLCHCARRR
jgi:hypothetical protein